VLIALGAYAAHHVVTWLLPAWLQLGSEALARVQRKLREATGRMFLLTLPPFVFDVPSPPRGRGMRPSPVFWTARIAMLIEGKNILLVFLTAVRACGRSPRHQDGGRTDRRGAAAHCPPLRHLPPFLSPPSYPLRTPPPFSSHEWYMD